MPRPSQSQSRSSQRTRLDSTGSAESVDESHHVANVVKTILNLSINKAIIKRSDITTIALKSDNRLYNRVISDALEVLRDVYGYELVDVENKNQKSMILCSVLEPATFLELNDSYRRKYTFLFIVLGYIFMKNGTVPESILWEFLQTVGIDEQREHSYFGDVQKLYESFIKQAYILRTKQSVEGMNEESIFISWGARAQREVSKKEVLHSMCEMLKRKPTDFKNQYIEAYGMESTENDETMDDE
ncbi:non-structural maintenance of chromosomes element 3 homolog [Anopheles ziemanni]|uniref:non-structural maintenance of chromosomes element 3 homolog n=1 Tax=Anopheles coustani TaxID=139045 RepID=UPI002658CD35|nr:non-structural maintenance of chromosomes element 3 homolog [Anopheles coustani]XP_058124652.1 non-structural maintenance of chromosomes element 3 homolog [Anopheles coustani]XP_058166744.1 non-structural maintenance of chromosomes element 3 homolog [Anopheles ziemanni]